MRKKLVLLLIILALIVLLGKVIKIHAQTIMHPTWEQLQKWEEDMENALTTNGDNYWALGTVLSVDTTKCKSRISIKATEFRGGALGEHEGKVTADYDTDFLMLDSCSYKKGDKIKCSISAQHEIIASENYRTGQKIAYIIYKCSGIPNDLSKMRRPVQTKIIPYQEFIEKYKHQDTLR